MTDATISLPASGGRKRLILTIGIAVAAVAILLAAVIVVIARVESVRTMWCGRVGLFCPKVPAKAVAAAKPAGCPDARMTGLLHERQPDDLDWSVAADVSGRVSLRQGVASTTGDSSVACFGSQFLATFTNMSQGTVYQCMGAIDGLHFEGVCDLSAAGPADISGTFTN